MQYTLTVMFLIGYVLLNVLMINYNIKDDSKTISSSGMVVTEANNSDNDEFNKLVKKYYKDRDLFTNIKDRHKYTQNRENVEDTKEFQEVSELLNSMDDNTTLVIGSENNITTIETIENKAKPIEKPKPKVKHVNKKHKVKHTKSKHSKPKHKKKKHTHNSHKDNPKILIEKYVVKKKK